MVLEQDERGGRVVRDVLDHVPGVLVRERVDAALGTRLRPGEGAGLHSLLTLDPEADQSADHGSDLDRLVLCQGAEVLDLDLAVGVLEDGERVDHAHGVALLQAFQLLDDLTVEVRVLKTQDDELHRSDCHVFSFRCDCRSLSTGVLPRVALGGLGAHHPFGMKRRRLHRSAVRVDDDRARHVVGQPSPSSVEEDGQEPREERHDREQEPHESHERAADAERLAVAAVDAEPHHPHPGRPARERPETDEVAAGHEQPARRCERRREPRRPQPADEGRDQCHDSGSDEVDAQGQEQVEHECDRSRAQPRIGRLVGSALPLGPPDRVSDAPLERVVGMRGAVAHGLRDVRREAGRLPGEGVPDRGARRRLLDQPLTLGALQRLLERRARDDLTRDPLGGLLSQRRHDRRLELGIGEDAAEHALDDLMLDEHARGLVHSRAGEGILHALASLRRRVAAGVCEPIDLPADDARA